MRELLKKTLLAAIGLICFGAGVYLTIHANIGVAPWDALNLGLSKTFGILYGTASVGVSVILILIDLLLKEHIGIGTILDAVLVGKTVDFLNWLDLIPSQENIWAGIVMMLIGFFIMGLSQVIYMKAGLCCGPRDSLLLACSRRIRKIPIGAVNVLILAVVLFAGWRLGGPIGLGDGGCVRLPFLLAGRSGGAGPPGRRGPVAGAHGTPPQRRTEAGGVGAGP